MEMKPKSEYELVKYASENIMNWSFNCNYWTDENSTCMFPLHDSNHLDLIEAELVKRGFESFLIKDSEGVYCEVNNVKGSQTRNGITVTGCCEYDPAQIRLCKLTCFVEGFEKWKELK